MTSLKLLGRKHKPQIRGNRRKLESWFTEARTPISSGKAYRWANQGKKGKRNVSGKRNVR